MRISVTGNTQDGKAFSFEVEAEPKTVQGGPNKGVAKERDLSEVLQHIGQQIIRNTEPMPGTDRSELADVVVSITY